MTSKEALDKLCMACDDDLLYEQSGILFPNELIEIIEQDLEVLEIIKKHFEIKMIDVLGTKTITIMEKREPFNIVAHIVTNKDHKLLKEALSNDR